MAESSLPLFDCADKSSTEKIPSNHRQAERKLIEFVRAGYLEIDADGRVWRVGLRRGLKSGGVTVKAVSRKTAEKKLASGYIMIRVMEGGKRHVGLAHRLVWQHLYGDIPDGLLVNHKDGNKSNNRPDNLELATYSENQKHAFRLGLSNEDGERNPAAKLTDEAVADIRRRRAAGEPLKSIASDHGVSDRTISKIARWQRWRHVS
jgi:hypothetical protein